MKILVALEDQEACESLKTTLLHRNIGVDTVCEGDIALHYALNKGYDVLVLDAQLPAFDLKRVLLMSTRQMKNNYIIVLTGSKDPQGRIDGLNDGADCYLQKPVRPQEVQACINAMLRRTAARTNQCSFGNTRLDVTRCSLCCGERQVHLTDKEFAVARLLLQSGDQVLTREAALAMVWGLNVKNTENHVEIYIGMLRKKLRAVGSDIRIKSDRGIGYHLEVAEV